ncbi:neprilysin-1 [Galendromus occidentalis]|uniref:Neprilysin-1 n=1 Tax=Galendromus occidentalis TaxID=34638 RepID=A0AAJ7SIX0_9ACAR|nr:neprilysin-1 [Galendromus occidentalis]
MDPNADPCHDFFQYACGTWNKVHRIPDDRPSISTFEVLSDQVQLKVRDLLEEPIGDRENPAFVKSKQLYKACMNTKTTSEKTLRNWITELGGWPLLGGVWKTPNTSLETFVSHIKMNFNLEILFHQWVGPDDRNSSINIIQFDQMPMVSRGALGRDWYIMDRFAKDRKAYQRMISDIATLLSGPGTRSEDIQKDIDNLVAFEIAIIKSGLPEVDRLDSWARYRKLSLRNLTDLVPAFNFTVYLHEMFKGIPVFIPDSESTVVYAYETFKALSPILERTDRRTIQNYAVWKVINSVLQYLPERFSKILLEFLKSSKGILSEKKEWRNCVDITTKKMGYGVSALFIRDHFDRSSKTIAQEMIHNLREAFNELLEENDWMDQDTKKVAREKANSMNEKIGYPDIFDNDSLLAGEYNELEINPVFLESLRNLGRWESGRTHIRLRQTVDRNRWTNNPAVVNAFYGPNKNDIVFPASILQPFFYSKHFPKSVNYGGIGVVIGHEITHGFDDKGRQFDKDGNMQLWWNNKTIETFRKRAECMIEQYSKYSMPGFGNVNGRLTQGENIADNGGLKQAFRAFKRWERQHGVEPYLPVLNMTHDQIFFLNFAQIWCGSMNRQETEAKLRNALHSPGPIRVLGTLANSRDFANAYNCPLGSRMNPVHKCSLW